MRNKKDDRNFRKIVATFLAASSLLPGTFVTEVSAEEGQSALSEAINESNTELENIIEELNLELTNEQKEILLQLLDLDSDELEEYVESLITEQVIPLNKNDLDKFTEILKLEDLSKEDYDAIQLFIELIDAKAEETVAEDGSLEQLAEKEEAVETIEPTVSKEPKETVETEEPKIQMFSANTMSLNEDDAEKMYEEVMNAPNASSAWKSALDYIEAYPNHSKLSEAVNDAARRIQSMGRASARNNDIPRAIHYYGLIKDEPLVKESVRNNARSKYNEFIAERMYENVMDAPNATSAWHAALEFIDTYPNHSKLSEAVNDAARRIYAMGQSHQRNNNYSTAIHYYEFIKDELVVNHSIRTDATLNYNHLIGNRSEEYEIYEAVMNAPNATSAWRAALEFIEKYPIHPKLSEAVNDAARRIYSMGETSRKNENTENALHYFGLIKDELKVSESLRTKASNGYKKSQQDNMYHEVINAPNATTAWIAAEDFKEQLPNHSKLSEAVNDAARRIYNMGRSNQRKNNFSTAIHYYELIKDENLLNDSLRTDIIKSYNKVIEERDKDWIEKLLNKVLDAPNATSAWTAAGNFKEQYPAHSKLPVAFESAGRRIYNMGVSSHKAKNYQLANTYYSLLLNEPMINDSIQSEVQTYFNQASKGQRLTTALDYFNLVMNAPNATSAWTRVNDYSNAFPYDQRLETAIDNAARRVLSMAVTHHKNGRYSNARTYYRPLANSSLISQSMSDKVDELMALANKNRKLLSESQYSNEVKNASSSSEAWNIAIEGINLYPNHSRTQKGLNEAANRNLKLGRSYQRNGNNTQAGIYFNRVYNEKRVSESIRTLARVFLNQLQETHRPVVYVDPGHGGYDPGATHPSYRNIGEKVLNLNTSMYLKEELESRGYIVIMSRENDTFIGLTERAIEANDAFADIFVSVHYNSMGGSGAARGIETFIHHKLQSNKNSFLSLQICII